MRLRAVLGQFVAMCAFGLMTSVPLLALQVVDYDPVVNDRFSSGFPLNPVPNTSENFIGIDYDWSGVGWSTTDLRKGFGFISPQHYLVASHFGGGATIALVDQDGQYFTASQSSVTNTGLGFLDNGTPDLSLGRLTSPVLNPIPRYAILDLNTSSTSNSSYAGQPVFLYGRGSGSGGNLSSPRISDGSVFSNTLVDYGTNNGYMTVRMINFTLEIGDSGSPAFIPWVNPEGDIALAIIGNNAAIAGDDGILNFLGRADVMNALNGLTTPDGFALRIDGNPSRTWVGGSGNPAERSNLHGNNQNWSGGNVPNDLYVLFNGLSTTFLNPVVNNNNINLRGLYFRSTESSALGFTFGGTWTLTIGRGGITNYDTSPQVFMAPLALGDHQYWQVGPGGVAVGNLNTNGHLLEVAGAGGLLVSGVVSGSGGLAVSDSRVVLQGNNSFTGSTWVHAGELVVNGSIVSSATLQIASSGQVRGSGSLPALNGAGRIAPGVDSQPAILAAHSVQADTELAFDFELRTMQPDYADAANSQNSLLRLINETPFASALSANNQIRFFINRSEIVAEDTFRGGFFTDSEVDFTAMLESASIEVYLADAAGDVSFDGISYSLYNGDYGYRILTQPETADFDAGVVNGRVLVLEFSPEPSTYASWVFNSFPVEASTWDTEPMADPSGDGIVNLLAYALALDPLANDNPRLTPRFVTEPEGGASFQFRRNRNADDLAYTVEASSDLQSWTTLDPAFNIFDPDPDGNGASELLSLDLASAIQSGFQFFRLRIELLNNPFLN